jgi:hypothetical protein
LIGGYALENETYTLAHQKKQTEMQLMINAIHLSKKSRDEIDKLRSALIDIIHTIDKNTN